MHYNNPDVIDLWAQDAVWRGFNRYSFQIEIIKRLKDDVVVWCNGEAARSVGKASEEIMGRPSSETWPHAAEYVQDDWEVYRSGKPKIDYRELAIGRDGGVIEVQTTKWPITFRNEPYVALVSIDLAAMVDRLERGKNRHGHAYDFEVIQAAREEQATLLAELRNG